MKKLKDFMKEDTPANVVGDGSVIGIDPNDPPVKQKKCSCSIHDTCDCPTSKKREQKTTLLRRDSK